MENSTTGSTSTARCTPCSGHLFPNASSYEPPRTQQRPLPSFIATFIHCLRCLTNENMKIVIAVVYRRTVLALGKLSYRLRLARPPLPGTICCTLGIPQMDTVLPKGALGKGSLPVGAQLAGGMFSPNTCQHHQLFQGIKSVSIHMIVQNSHRTMQYCEKPTGCVYCFPPLPPPPFTWTFGSTLEIIPRFIFCGHGKST